MLIPKYNLSNPHVTCFNSKFLKVSCPSNHIAHNLSADACAKFS